MNVIILYPMDLDEGQTLSVIHCYRLLDYFSSKMNVIFYGHFNREILQQYRSQFLRCLISYC